VILSYSEKSMVRRGYDGRETSLTGSQEKGLTTLAILARHLKTPRIALGSPAQGCPSHKITSPQRPRSPAHTTRLGLNYPSICLLSPVSLDLPPTVSSLAPCEQTALHIHDHGGMRGRLRLMFKHSICRHRALLVVTDGRRPTRKITNILCGGQTKSLIDALHSGSITLGDAVHRATKVNI